MLCYILVAPIYRLFFNHRSCIRRVAVVTFLAALALAGVGLAGAEGPPSEGTHPAESSPVVQIPGNYNWTGFYTGFSLGSAINNSSYTLTPSGNFAGDPDNLFRTDSGKFTRPVFLGGVQLGYNYQFCSYILGLETDFKYDSYDYGEVGNRALPSPLSSNFIHTVTDKTPYFGTVRGRLGYTPCNRLMVYGTGGLVYGWVNSTSDLLFTSTGDHYFGSSTGFQAGWTAGGGIEYALDRCWSVKLEYLYMDLGSTSYTYGSQISPGFTYTTNLHTVENAVQAGINYKFGSTGTEGPLSEGPLPSESAPAVQGSNAVAPVAQASGAQGSAAQTSTSQASVAQAPAAPVPTGQAPAAQAPPANSWWPSFSPWQPQWPSCCNEPWFPQLLGLQFTGFYQNAPNFHNPYQGGNSFSFIKNLNGEISPGRNQDFTHTYGVYLGSQLTPNLQAYVDTELFQGFGLSNGEGLGGYVNGDVVRAGSANLPKDPYIARAYLRYTCPLEGGEMEKVERCQDQIPGEQDTSRLEFKVGRFAVTDDLDQNRYANNNRTQFEDYYFLFNTAWDYTADTRGYTWAALAALYQPRWRLAFAMGMCPNTQNGANYDWFNHADEMFRELGYNLEFDFKPNNCGTVIRLLAFLNTGRMGDYDTALKFAEETNTTPDLHAVEKLGGTKYGFAANFEQPLADDGDTGIFGRAGWNDGHHETWMYTENDRLLTLGGQLSGVHWKRADDRVGIAYGAGGLSDPHRNYLAAGGLGMLIGDGALNYNWEQVFEVYYSWQVTKFFAITPDFQFIQNPGYNQDRGPVEVYGVRFHVVF